MKDWIKRLSWIPAVIVMAIVFLFSAKTADESNQQSSALVEVTLTLVENVRGTAARQELEADPAQLDKLEHIIRKCAHASEYALLAFCVGFHVLAARKERGFRYYLVVIGFCVLYAVSDEVHQLFVKGRSGQISDVCVDAAGAIAGALLLYLFAGKRISRMFHQIKRLEAGS